MPTRWQLGGKFVIPHYDIEGVNYLERYKLIVTPFFAIYLHRINTPDMRPVLHDHPWSFIAIPLIGGYTERVPTDDFAWHRAALQRYEERPRIQATIRGQIADVEYTRPRRIRWWNFKRAEGLHFIESTTRTPVWSLILRGPYRREWGYVDPDGTWTHYAEHENARKFDEAVGRYENQMRPG
jgi:hypothetical protein